MLITQKQTLSQRLPDRAGEAEAPLADDEDKNPEKQIEAAVQEGI